MALIRKLPIELNIGFIRRRGLFFVFSAALILSSIGLSLTQGLNFGVDFRGGILMEVRTPEPADLGQLRDRLGSLGIGEVSLQQFGEPTDVLINVAKQQGDEEQQIAAIQAVKEALGSDVELRRQEFVGPKIGDELKEAGLLATVLALLGIGVYIWLRFEWQFGVAALIALVHDVVATIGFYSLTQIEFNLGTLAAVLTIAGGFLFGITFGTLYVVVGATLGATAIFLLARSTLGDLLRAKAGPWLQRMEAGFSENAFSYMLVLRLIPLFPFFVVNLVPAFLGVSLRTYVVGTFIGIIPGTLVFILAGAGLGSVFDQGGAFTVESVLTPQIIAGLIGLSLLSLLPVVYKHVKARRFAA